MTLSIFLFLSSSVLIPILVGTHYLLNLLMYNTCMDLQARFRYVLRYTHFHVPLPMFTSRGSGLRQGLGMHFTQDVSMQNANPTVSCVGVIAIEVTTGKTEHGVRNPREDPGGSV